jgi:hypothetical protein
VSTAQPLRIARRATRIHDGARKTQLLAEWRGLDAYVLLGDPGAGKSWAFEDECRACDGLPVRARDVVDGVAKAPAKDQTVFIDGLDEVRAGASDGRTQFGAVRKWLHEHGRPRFRLSCREADWRGQSDQQQLETVAPGEQVVVLHLDPLTDEEIAAVLRSRPAEVPNASEFLERAEQARLDELLRNPLLLDLTIKAVAGNKWPPDRAGVYAAACRQMAIEKNQDHLAANPLQPAQVDELLADAGKLCAVMLLSGKTSITLQEPAPEDAVSLIDTTLLKLGNARAALACNVFTTEGDRATPRHRSIAEYLGGQALARAIANGLPLGRVLALMQGIDGRPVEPLRGLFAWLVVHHPLDRARLMRLDPIGVVLNGDAAALSTGDRIELLHALAEEAQRDKWLRQDAWVSHPFGALATADMADTYATLLRNASRDEGHQIFMDCVFDALRHGQKMAQLLPLLEAWVQDDDAWIDNRQAAYQAWRHQSAFNAVKAHQWLDDIRAGVIKDDDDALAGELLMDLYPRHIEPAEVFRYFHAPKRSNYIGQYALFWRSALLEQSRPEDFAILADMWLQVRPSRRSEIDDHTNRHLSRQLLHAAFAHAADAVSNERLYDWLDICIDEHRFSYADGGEPLSVARWLEANPDRLKAIVEIGYQRTLPNEQGHRFFWEAEQRLHGARLPRDWLFWLLDQAGDTGDEALAQYCFVEATRAVCDPPIEYDTPTMEQVEQWVARHENKWSKAPQWLEDVWFFPLDHYRGEQARRRVQHRAENERRLEDRRQSMAPYLPDLLAGQGTAQLLRNIAWAHDERFADVRGDTPVERVQNLLVSDHATAQAALVAIDRVLDRNDLPSPDDIVDLEIQGQYHSIRPAALLAASRAFDRAPNTPVDWPEPLAQRLVAFALTDGDNNMPGWFEVLAHQRPALVAPIFIRYVTAGKKFKVHATGLSALGSKTEFAPLARLVLPPLLHAFPARASEAARGTLNRSLLSAIHVLEDAEAGNIIDTKLAHPRLDAMQRIAWLVASLPYASDAAQRLVDWVGENQRRAVELGVALEAQDSLKRVQQLLPAQAIRSLLEMLAPMTPPDRDSEDGVVRVEHRRADLVRALFNMLSASPEASASDALLSLAALGRTGGWQRTLDYSLRTQQHAAREAQFQIAAPADVARALAKQAPANVADLQALVVDHLHDLVKHWRDDDTRLVRRFWQQGKNGSVPHDENRCRDEVLDGLRERLKPQNIHVEREASAAGDKRADARAEFMRDGRRMAVPIEAKTEAHRALWTAWRDQLQVLYTGDPAAGGYGIYLILWFGVKPRSLPEGEKPHSAEHLRELLIQRIPSADRQRLAIVVLDLAMPHAPVN